MDSQKPARVKVCTCGQEFQVMTRGQRSCPACIELRKAYQAQHPRPIRICEDCGAESRECTRGLCPPCYAAHCARASADYKQWKAERKERRKAKKEQGRQQRQEDQKRLDKSEEQHREDQFFANLRKAPRAVQEQCLLTALKYLVKVLEGKSVEMEETINPEEVPADDQDRIDATFNDLMGDIDL